MELLEIKERFKKVTSDEKKNHFIIAYETKVSDLDENESQIKRLKSVSDGWAMDFFDKQIFAKMIKNGNLGFNKKRLIMTRNGNIQLDESLSKLSQAGLIIVLNNPMQTKETKK